MTRLLAWLLVGVLAYAGTAFAAPDSAGKIAALEPDVDRLEARLREIMKNYENRRGLIGSVEARIRYEDAVYDFLVGNYEEAANSFFVLVRSEALTTPALQHDSQWYLAEALFEIENYETAVDAYGDIVEAGPLHPFFADAVRRQLEIYGILRDTKRFDDLYALYIATGQVPSTDLVKYTVAKSYYRQGDHSRAVEILAQIGPESSYYGRARYLSGVLLTSESNFADAIPHFVAVAQLEPKSSLDRAVVEAATMAVARLYYETGQYTLAAEAYSRLTNESEHFVDELYELVWTFIEQDAWTDAIRAIDTFLIAFPEHRYAMQLQLLRGHLHVKQETFPEALTAYDGVVHDYTPMRDKIATIDLDREDPVAFFDRVVTSGTIEVGGEALPPYVTDMLFSNDVMARARAAHDEMRAQNENLDASHALIADIESALATNPYAIGTFAWGRHAIAELRDEVLRVMRATMSVEVSYLDENLPGTMQPEVDALEAEIALLAAEAQKAVTAKAAETDRNDAYDSQVRAAQNQAFEAEAKTRDLQLQADSLESFLATATLSTDERSTVSQKLENTRTQLKDATVELERLMADSARGKEPASAGGAGPVATDLPDRSDLLARYRALQSRIVGYRSDVAAADAAAVFAAGEKVWAELTAIDDDATLADTQLEATQQRELALLREELATETVHVAESTAALASTRESTAALVAQVARYGLAELEGEFDDAILRADMGVVDVYWLEKTGISDQITSLYEDRAEELRKLDQRYGMIEQKFSGTANSTEGGHRMRRPERTMLLLALTLSGPASAQDDSASAQKAYTDLVDRFSDRMKEFTVDAESIAEAREAEARRAVSRGYDEQIAELSKTQAQIRKDAVAHFEAFLAKYPRSAYAPHVMFRLGDLYYDESEEVWYAKDQELEKAMEASPDADLPLPQKDYTKSIALYQWIIADYPNYEYIDGCYYMLGYTHSELNSMQLDEDVGKDWFLRLVNEYPQSEFAADANMRLGEYYFDHNELILAIAHYQKVVDQGEGGRLYDRGLYKLAWSYYKKSDYDIGLQLLTALLDYSRAQFLDTGEESPMEPEAIEYTAISFSDVADRANARPVEVAQAFYQRAGEREYEPKIYKRLADVLTKQARYEDAIAAYAYLQTRWPNDPENPTYQFRIAQLNMSLPIPDPDAANVAITRLNELYKEGTSWRVANRNDPEALATADRYIEESLASVATNYHVHAQQTGSVEDYAKAAELYAQYLKTFPFSDNYYEITWYLADTLAKSGKLDEATKLYEVLANAEGSPYRDGARYELMLARRQILVQKYGKEDALPPDAKVERTVTLPSGKERKIYELGADHKAFIDLADALANTTLTGEHAKSLEDNRPAIAYICAQIFYAHGRFDEARPRFEEIIQRWPQRDEAAFAASLVLDSYQAEEDLATLKLKAAHYSGMVLGQSKAAAEKKQVFQSIEEGATFKLAMDHVKSGNRAAAADAFLAFMKAYPNSKYIKDAHYNAANSLEIIGRVDEANALFESYVQKWPKDERSRGLFFRIAGNYANVLELQKAIANYDALVKNFPSADNQDAPAALYNSAFLSIGLGDHKGAALKFEQYAKKFPNQPDAEQVRFQAGAQWEQVSAKSAIEFYDEYLATYTGKSAQAANPDHVMEAYYKIAVLKEQSGVRGAALDAAWNDVSEAYANLAPSGRVGPTGRNYAAHAAFRKVEQTFEAFKVIKFGTSDEKNAELLTKTKRDQLDAIVRDSTSIIETYQDFEYSSAALYIQGAAYFAYADMLFDAPPPKKFTEEQVQFYQEQIDELRLPVEDRGKNRLNANLDKAKEAKRWSPWVSKTLELLNERYPTEYAKEKVEVRAEGDSNIVPSASAMDVRANAATTGAQP